MIEALLLLWQANQFDQFDDWKDDPVVQQAPRQNPDALAYLVIATPNAVKTIPYRTMRACWRAVAAAQTTSQSAGVRPVAIVPIAQFSCIPRN